MKHTLTVAQVQMRVTRDKAENIAAACRLIRRAAEQVLAHESYRRAAQAIREEFLSCGGAEQAAEYILMQAPETAAAEQNGRA